MTIPPPLPSISFDPKRGVCIGLGVASVAAILTGQFITKGALYGYSFMGIALGVTSVLNDTFTPGEGAGYLLMFVGAVLIILLMALLFAGLIIGLGIAVYIASCRSLTPTVVRLACYLHASIAGSTLIGLSLSRTLPSSPDFQGEVHVESYFFLWPQLFGTLALLYATLLRNPRNS